VGNVLLVLSQISYAFHQCKKFENRLRFDKVTDRLKVGTFLRHGVYSLQYIHRRIGMRTWLIIPTVMLKLKDLSKSQVVFPLERGIEVLDVGV